MSGFTYDWEVSDHFEDVPLAEAPAWVQARMSGTVVPSTASALEMVWEHDLPPVRLPVWAMDLWTGQKVVDGTDGEERNPSEAQSIDRSETLWRIGKALATAGAKKAEIAAAVANRDVALGYEKYSNRHNGHAAQAYNDIATKATSEYVAPGTPVLKLGKGETEPAQEVEDEDSQADAPEAKPTDRWVIVPASLIDPNGAHVNWVWEGYLASGAVTEIVGLWKSGKTTLLCHLVKAMESGGMFCGMALCRGRVLIITEEHSSLWAERRDDLGITDNVHFMFRPFLGRPDLRTWRRFMQFVADAVVSGNYDVVILDPLTTQAPIEDENDAAEMTRVIVEFRRIVEAGAALMVAHHPSKAPMGQGRSSRGSGALPGFVDIILEFGRYQPEHAEDTRRVLLGLSRFKETPTEVVLDLTEDGYQAVGTVARNGTNNRRDIITGLMTDVAITRETIRDRWPADCGVPKPSISQLKIELAALASIGRIQVTGDGKRGSPLTYSRKTE